MESPASQQEQVLEMIVARRPLDQILERVAAVIEQDCPAARAAALVPDGGGRLRVVARSGLPLPFVAAVNEMDLGLAAGMSSDASTEPAAGSGYDPLRAAWQPLHRLAAEHGLHACWSAPLVGASNQPLGVLTLFYTQPHELTRDEQQLVSRASHLASAAIEHHMTERALRGSEARGSAVMRAALDCILIIDRHGIVQEFNPSAERTFGYTREEAVGRTLAELIIPPALRKAHSRGLQHYLATGEGPVLGKRIEVPAIHRDGHEFPVELSILDISTDDTPYFVGYIRDISEQKRAEREREERARINALSAEIGAVLTDGGVLQPMLQRCAEIVVQHLDAAFARIWTLDEKEQVLHLVASAGQYTHLDGPHSRVPVGAFKIGMIASERTAHLTNDVQSDPRVGDKEWARREDMVAFAGYPMLLEGRLFGVVAMFARRELSDDVLETLRLVAERLTLTLHRKETEERMRLSEQRHRTLVEASAAVVWSTSPVGEFRSEQPRWNAFTGQSTEQAHGLGWLESVHPDDRRRTHAEWTAAIRDRRLFQMDHRLRRSDGEYRHMQARAVPVADDHGEVLEWIGVHTDITEQVRAQQTQHHLALEQAARREAEARQTQLRRYSEELERSNQELQAFAYVASHDLQEPLRKIRAFGDVLREDFGSALGTEGSDFLQRMQNAAERMQTLINDLLAYSRVTTRAQPFREVDLNSVVEEVLDTLELRTRETGASIEVKDLPSLQADPLQMQQLLQNLIGNALKFHKPDTSPRVTVLTRPAPDAPDERSWIELVVQDSGIGFDERYLDRIFSIFQRLHGRGGFEGTGVGLAICRKIAERHGGSITAHSAPDQGASFVVRLPLTQPERDHSL
jgi:PAS domain S-box-containing protein